MRSFHIPEIVRDHIHLLVGENELIRSADLLTELAKYYAPNRSNEVTVIRRGIVAVEKSGRINTLDFEAISQERNRLGLAILDLADSICLSS